MQGVGARQVPQGAHVPQIARQFLVVERLGVPFGLTQDGGAAVCVQARDIKLMVGMPPGADPADAPGSMQCKSATISGMGFR